LQATLTPPVVVIEQALAAANQAILAECHVTHVYDMTLEHCADPTLMQGSTDLARTLAQTSRVLLDASHMLTVGAPPPLGQEGMLSLLLAREDLLLGSEGLA
jgi:hypothetical protein